MKGRLCYLVFGPLFLALSSCAESHKAEPPVRELTEQEIRDLMVGSSIQATRGSDSQRMMERLEPALKEGRRFLMISPEDVPDDWNIVAPAGVGGGGAWEYVLERTKEQNLPRLENTQVRAIQTLSEHMGKRFDAIVRVEPAGATVGALLTANALGIPIVDACLSGRARPEIEQQIPWLVGIPSTPAALFTRWGDTVIIQNAVDDYRAEDLARAVAVASGGGSSIAMNPMTGKDLKRGTLAGNLSQAILFGQTVREAVEQKKDPISALVEVSGGFKLFQGIVTKSEEKGERGFSWADVEIRGINEYEGHTYKVFVKNENIFSWLDDKPDVMSPDLICNLNPTTGDAITGAGLGGYPIGLEVSMVGIPAPAQWRTETGIEVLGPRHFGFDFDYIPIEELQASRKLSQ